MFIKRCNFEKQEFKYITHKTNKRLKFKYHSPNDDGLPYCQGHNAKQENWVSVTEFNSETVAKSDFCWLCCPEINPPRKAQ